MKRPWLFFFALIVGLNLGHSPHGWIYDRAYDACMATTGEDDWKCEDFMPNPIKPGPRQPAPGAVWGAGQRASEITLIYVIARMWFS